MIFMGDLSSIAVLISFSVFSSFNRWNDSRETISIFMELGSNATNNSDNFEQVSTVSSVFDKGREGLCVRPVSVRNAWWKKSAPAHSIPQYTISNTTFNWNKWLWCVQNAKETFLVQTLLALFVCSKYELSLSVCLWKIVQYRKLKNETHDQKMLFFH